MPMMDETPIDVVRRCMLRNHGGIADCDDAQIRAQWNNHTPETRSAYLKQDQESPAPATPGNRKLKMDGGV